MQLDGVLKLTVENHDEVESSARYFRSVKTDMIASLDDEEAIDHDHASRVLH